MMATIRIQDANEAKQKLTEALTILDAISKYSANHGIPTSNLCDADFRQRLQNIFPKPPLRSHPILESSGTFSKEEVQTLSKHCYNIEDTTGSDDVLGALEAYGKQTSIQRSTSKGELIDSIIRTGISKSVRTSVANILDVIGSLALWQIREVEAKALAAARGRTRPTTNDKSHAATLMWQCLNRYNGDATRGSLDLRIRMGIRWTNFLHGKDIGLIVAVCKLPPSLKSPYPKLASVVYELPEIRTLAIRSTPCVQNLLDAKLVPWGENNERQTLAQNVVEPNPKRQRRHTVEEGGTGDSEAYDGFDTSSTTAAEALTNLRQTAIDNMQQQLICPNEASTDFQLSEHSNASTDVHDGVDGAMEEVQDNTLDTGIEGNAPASFNYDLAHDPSAFSVQFGGVRNALPFPFDYDSAYDPSAFSTNYNDIGMSHSIFSSDYVAGYNPFVSTTSFMPPLSSTR